MWIRWQIEPYVWRWPAMSLQGTSGEGKEVWKVSRKRILVEAVNVT